MESKKSSKHFTNMSLDVQADKKNSLNQSLQDPTEIPVGISSAQYIHSLCNSEIQNINEHKDQWGTYLQGRYDRAGARGTSTVLCMQLKAVITL